MTDNKQCICCKKNLINDSNFCQTCFDYLIPHRGQTGITWGDIWALVAHWYATHDETDKDYEFCNDVIKIVYREKYHG